MSVPAMHRHNSREMRVVAGPPTPTDDAVAARRLSGTIWAIPLMCLGLGLLACVVLIPASGESRRLARQRDELVREVDRMQAQADRNAEFLHRLGRDADLGRVVAERQAGGVEGVESIALPGMDTELATSPFAMLTLPEPPPLPPPATVGGRLAAWCRDAELRPWLLAGSLLTTASGLLLGRPR